MPSMQRAMRGTGLRKRCRVMPIAIIVELILFHRPSRGHQFDGLGFFVGRAAGYNNVAMSSLDSLGLGIPRLAQPALNRAELIVVHRPLRRVMAFVGCSID